MTHTCPCPDHPAPFVVEVPGRPPTPNHRLHWAQRYRVGSKWRMDAYLSAMHVQNQRGEGFLHWDRVTIRPTFGVKVKRDRDADNLIASLKNHVDGLIDAGVLRGDTTRNVEWLPPIVEKAGRDFVRLEVRAMHGNDGLKEAG